MNLDSIYQRNFNQIRSANKVTAKDFERLFDCVIHDRWPLQSRIAEFDFLAGLSSRVRDGLIMQYALRCWADVQGCALKRNNCRKYVCCLVFDEENDLLWPEMFFCNSNLDMFPKMGLSAPHSSYGTYILSLLQDLKQMHGRRLLEEQGEHPIIYVDFEIMPGENRSTLAELCRVPL